MNRGGVTEDAVFLLYLGPFIASGVHGLYLWITEGLLAGVSASVYLAVTKDPLTFLIGLASVSAAVLVDISSSNVQDRKVTTARNSWRLQIVGVLSLILSALFAWSASGYSGSASRFLTVFIEGRYSLIFPLFVLGFSLLLSLPRTILQPSGNVLLEVIGLVLVASSPLGIFALTRSNQSISIGISASLLQFAAGFLILLYAIRKAS